jgi:hypothetical protein
MKMAVQTFFGVALSLLIVLGGGRFTIGKMVCLESGYSSYSMGKAKDCCEKNSSSDQSVKRSCCDLVNVSYSLDDYNPSNNVKVAVQGFEFYHLPFSINLFPFNIFSSKKVFSGLPPPDIKDRLYSFRSLLL